MLSARRAFLAPLAVSAALHVGAGLTIVALAKSAALPPAAYEVNGKRAEPPSNVRSIVFLAPDLGQLGSGGGGGGNQRAGAIRRAHAIGTDTMTMPVKKSAEAAAGVLIAESAATAQLVLDAKPLASGTFNQIGLPAGEAPDNMSTGSGSGGGVGTGTGAGIGSGRGSGFGPGAGGGTGGGTYRPGGAVTAPRVITVVTPTYTNDALLRKIQGTVVLELVVTDEGEASQIRIVRSLDPAGLDEQAMKAAAQWRFEPGRLAGTPVNVLVTVMLDFWIR